MAHIAFHLGIPELRSEKAMDWVISQHKYISHWRVCAFRILGEVVAVVAVVCG